MEEGGGGDTCGARMVKKRVGRLFGRGISSGAKGGGGVRGGGCWGGRFPGH